MSAKSVLEAQSTRYTRCNAPAVQREYKQHPLESTVLYSVVQDHLLDFLAQALLRGHRNVHCGAVNFPQRFGGSLNLNVHFHVVVPDAVFVEEGDSLTLLQLKRPSQLDLDEVTHNTAVRALRWLKRQGHLAEHNSNAPQSATLLDACLENALGLGGLVKLTTSGKAATGRSLTS